jgi:hypothetical protein
VADQHDPGVGRPQRLGEVLEPVLVEVVGRLVEQQEVVAGTEQARQPHPVALTDRQLASRRVRSVTAPSAASATSTCRSASHASSARAASSASA